MGWLRKLLAKLEARYVTKPTQPVQIEPIVQIEENILYPVTFDDVRVLAVWIKYSPKNYTVYLDKVPLVFGNKTILVYTSLANGQVTRG